MLPSRGILRSLPSARATSSITTRHCISRSPRRLGDGRNFGTSLCSGAAPWASLRSANSRLGGIAGTVALGGSLETRRALSLWGSSKTEPAPQPAAAPSASASAPSPSPPVDPSPAGADWVSASSSPSPIPPAMEPAATMSNVQPTVPLHYDLDIAALLDLPEEIGFLKTLGLDFGWGPSSLMQWTFEHIHVYTGLPWWASIAVTALAVRLAFFKPSLMAQDTSARMQKLQRDPRYTKIRDQLQQAMATGDTAAMNQLRRDQSLMHKNAGVNPLRGLWGLLQLPFGYGVYRVMSGAADIPVRGMETGGFLWATDLTVPDPMYILPIAGPVAMFFMMKLGSKYGTAQAQAQQKLVLFVLGPISLLFTMYLPAGVQWYFLVSGGIGILQNWIFNMPGFRKMFNIPLPPEPAPSPSSPSSSSSSTSYDAIPTTATTVSSSSGTSGPTYQPPRASAGNTTTPNGEPAAGEKNEGAIASLMHNLKQTVDKAKGGAGNYAESARKRHDAKEAKKYEAKRMEQERQKFWSQVRKK